MILEVMIAPNLSPYQIFLFEWVRMFDWHSEPSKEVLSREAKVEACQPYQLSLHHMC